MFAPPIKSLKARGNPWNGNPSDRGAWAGGVMPAFDQGMEYCLFTCCTTAFDTSLSKGGERAGLALAKLLTHANVSFGTLGGDENCCGDLASAIGGNQVFSDLEKKNTDRFMAAGVQKILTSSPHCMNTFNKQYGELKNTVQSEHYIELFDRLISKGQITLSRAIDQTVTYHDPCYLGRHNGIYDAPRRVLNSIPGLKLIEMDNNRGRSLCCGGGGGGPWKQYPTEHRFGVVRVRQAMKTGASVIATACPYCIRMLNEAIVELNVGNSIKVQDISELLLTSVEKSNEKLIEKIDTKTICLEQEDCHV